MYLTKRLAVLTLLVALATPALASESRPSIPAPDIWKNILEQTATNLASGDVDIRKQALRNTIYLAATHGSKAPLDGIVGRLITTYETDRDAEVRQLALAAAIAVGSDGARRYVEANVPKDQLRSSGALIAGVLADYKAQYGDR